MDARLQFRFQPEIVGRTRKSVGVASVSSPSPGGVSPSAIVASPSTSLDGGDFEGVSPSVVGNTPRRQTRASLSAMSIQGHLASTSITLCAIMTGQVCFLRVRFVLDGGDFEGGSPSIVGNTPRSQTRALLSAMSIHGHMASTTITLCAILTGQVCFLRVRFVLDGG